MKDILTQNDLKNFKAEIEHLRDERNKLQEKLIELYILYNVSKALSFPLQLNELFELSMHLIATSLQAEKYAILLLNESKNQLFIQASSGLNDETVRNLSFQKDEGLVWEAINKNKPILINDTDGYDASLFYKNFEKEIGSYLCVPLRVVGGNVIGALVTHSKEKNAYGEHELELYSKVAEHIATAIENALVFQKTIELSYKDPLTQLFNRRYFFERLEKEVQRASRYGRVLSLLMIDVDYFKAYNDRMGHLKGDIVLKQIAHIMTQKLRSHDVLARFGGEEFMALLPETNKSSATSVAEKLRAEIEAFHFEGEELQPKNNLTVTIGISAFPQDAMDSFQLINLADKTMYEGKKIGGNIVVSNGVS